MTRPARPQDPRRNAFIHRGDELRVEPEPVRITPRRACTFCGDEIFAGEWFDMPTGRCEHCVDREVTVRQWMAVIVVIFLAMVAIAVLGWITAPRSAPDPTAPSPAGDVSRPSTSASGPGLIGAPASAAPGRTATGPGAPIVLAPPLEVIRGTATHYCLPGQRGTAYCTRGYGPEDLVAAIDTDLGFRKGAVVTVRSLSGPEDVTVTIVDVCGCAGDRLIDLTSGAFRRLAPLGLGVIPVTVELAEAVIPLPATDTREERPPWLTHR